MPKAVIIVGLGFGDEGKGTCVDYLAREMNAHTVVRFNGGGQAAHNVVLPDGRHHTFSQFGSGTFAGALTHLSRHMLVNPSSLYNEAKHLYELGVSEPYKLLTIEDEALLTTPPHVLANHIRETRREDGRHGSCGMGIGETMAYALQYPEDAPRVGDLKRPKILEEKVNLLADRLRADLGSPMIFWNHIEAERFFERCEILAKNSSVVGKDYLPEVVEKHNTVFEGAQGVLLDQDFGFHPYTTWSTTTFDNALNLLDGLKVDVTRMGVIRSYLTRHGPGPFPSHNPEMDGKFTEYHNRFSEWQREFRRGYLDLVLLRYALDVVGGVDELTITHVDWIFHKDAQYSAEHYLGMEYTEQGYTLDGVFRYDDFTNMTRIVVRRFHDTDKQLEWQSKITEALEKIDLSRISLRRNFRAYDPAGTIEQAFFGTKVAARVTLLSHGPTYQQKVRVGNHD